MGGGELCFKCSFLAAGPKGTLPHTDPAHLGDCHPLLYVTDQLPLHLSHSNSRGVPGRSVGACLPCFQTTMSLSSISSLCMSTQLLQTAPILPSDSCYRQGKLSSCHACLYQLVLEQLKKFMPLGLLLNLEQTLCPFLNFHSCIHC